MSNVTFKSGYRPMQEVPINKKGFLGVTSECKNSRVLTGPLDGNLARAATRAICPPHGRSVTAQKEKAAHVCRALCRARVAEELQRRRGTRIGEHLKLVLSIIDRQVH